MRYCVTTRHLGIPGLSGNFLFHQLWIRCRLKVQRYIGANRNGILHRVDRPVTIVATSLQWSLCRR